MAESNLGSMYVSLGIKDAVTTDLERIRKEFSGTDDAAKSIRRDIKEINNALKNTSDSKEFTVAMQRATDVLQRAKSDAKDLGDVLRSLGSKSFETLFDGKMDARNLASYQKFVQELKGAINDLGHAPGDTTFKLFKDLDSAGKWIGDIQNAGDAIRRLKTDLEGVSDKSLRSELSDVLTGYQNLRKGMISDFNSGEWKRPDNLLLEQQYELLVKAVQLRQRLNSMPKSESIAATGTDNATQAIVKTEQVLEKTEIQAQKTEGAVAKIGTSGAESAAGFKTELNEILNAFRGGGSKLLGVQEAGEKGRAYVDILNQINVAMKKAPEKDNGDVQVKNIQKMTDNALQYLSLLQKIDVAEEKIHNLRASNPNIDEKSFKQANGLLGNFRERLTGLESKKFLTGVDSANVLGQYGKTLSMTIREVNAIMSKFTKSNPLSELNNAFDKTDMKLSRVRNKIGEISGLIANGRKNGYATRMLTEPINNLINLRKQLVSILENQDGRLTDSNYLKSVFSQVTAELSKAGDAVSTYNRERQRAVELEREHQSAIEQSARIAQEANKSQSAWDAAKQKASSEELQRQMQASADKEAAAEARVEEILQQRAHASEMAAAREVEAERQRQSAIEQSARIAQETYTQEIKDRERVAKTNADLLQGQMQARADAEKRIQKAEETREKEWQRLTKEPHNFGVYNMPGRMSVSTEYRDLAKVYDDAARSLQTKHGENDKQISKQLEEYQKSYKEIEDKIKSISPKMDGKNFQGKELGSKNLLEYKDLLSQLEHLKNTKGTDVDLAIAQYKAEEREIQKLIDLANEYRVVAEKSSRMTYTPYNSDNYNQSRELRTAELRNYMTEKYRQEDADARRQKKDEREDLRLEKQRQNELKITKDRIQSVQNALDNLQRSRFEAKAVGVNTAYAEEKIASLKTQLAELKTIMAGLESGDKNAIGRLGDIGTGREVTAANKIAAEYDRTTKQVSKNIDETEKRAAKMREDLIQSARKVREDLVGAFNKANHAASGLSSTVQDLKSLFFQGGLVFGIHQFLMSVIQTGGELEKQHIALQSVLGDMQNANTMFAQIKQLALESPFTFSELNKDVKQLAAYGVEYDDLYDTTKRLADVSSGLGVSFERIALAFGQVQARGWLDGKELRQIAYAGIPMLDRLSEMYSKREGKKVTTSEVKSRISSRNVSFEDVKSIFWGMTDAGGQFYNMQNVLSNTLLGRFNKLKDAWEIMLSEFASGNSVVGSGLMGILDTVTSLVQVLHTFAPVVISAFAGPAVRKAMSMMDGGLSKSILSAKGQLAQAALRKNLSGKPLTNVEKELLATKNQITGVEIRNLSASGALNKSELQRLFLSGRITKQMYLQGLALQEQEAVTKRINLFERLRGLLSKAGGGAIWGQMKNGISSLVSGISGFFGGLPGMALSAGVAAFSYWEQKSSELDAKVQQSQEELENRSVKISEFRRDNDVAKTIKGGDAKAVDNMIESYEDKLSEIAPQSASAFKMSAEEEADHKKRLQYLADDLELIQKATDAAKEKLSDKDTFKDSYERIGKAGEKAKALIEASNAVASVTANAVDRADFSTKTKEFETYVTGLKNYFLRTLPELQSKDTDAREKAQETLKSMTESIISQLGWTNEVGDYVRSSLYQSLGMQDNVLEETFAKKLMGMIDTTFPEIADRIRAHKELDAESRKKVENLMSGAKAELSVQYPYWEERLKNLLAASDFKATIRIVTQYESSFDDLEKQVYNNVVGDGNKGDGWMLQSQKFEALKPYLKGESSYYGASNKVKSALDDLWNELKRRKEMSAQGKLPKSELDKQQEKYDTLRKAAYEGLGYTYIPEDKKSNKVPKDKNANQVDKELKDLKERISLYKKMYSEIQKYKDLYGKGALMQLKSDGEFGAIFKDKKRYPISDYENYETSVKEMLSGFSLKSAERKNFRDETIAGIQTENRKLVEDGRKDELDILSTQLGIIKEQYDTYKKIFDLTGDKTGSQNMAFGGMVNSPSYKKYLQEQLELAVLHDNVQSGLSLKSEEVEQMDLNNVKDRYGKDSRTYSLRKQLEEENNKVRKETIDLLADIIEKNATISQQIEQENVKYQHQLAMVDKMDDPQMKERAKTGLNKTHNETLAKLEFEQFKQDTDWVTIFDDLDRVSTGTINSMIGKIDAFSKTTGLSVEAVKQLRSSLSKLRDEQIERNPISGIVGGMQRGNAISSYLHGGLGGQYKNGNSYVLTKQQAKKMGLQAGGKGYTKTELESEKKSAYTDANNGVSGLANKFKALQECMEPVLGLFEALGQEDTFAGQAANTINSAFGAATQVSGGLNSLGLENAGPYGAAAAAALSVASSIFAQHDATLQKEIEASEQRQEEMENLTSNVKSVIEDTLGGVYTYKMSKSSEKTMTEMLMRLKFKDFLANNLRFGGSQITDSLTEEEIAAIRDLQNALENPDNSYLTQLASLQLQKAEAENKLAAENDKKNKDDSKIDDYEQEIEEMQQKIDSFTQDFLKDVYSIDMKSWASELTDAVVSAWENGEDAVDAYREKVKDMVKDVTKNIVSQKILETALEEPLSYLEGILQEKGKLDETDIDQLADQLYNIGDVVVPEITGVFEALKNRGWDLRSDSSSSTTNSIKSITEETADLLASYVNSIRADVAVNRANVKSICDSVSVLPKMSTIAASQLTSMNQLVSLAEYRNAKLDEMYTWMKHVSSGVEKVKVG